MTDLLGYVIDFCLFLSTLLANKNKTLPKTVKKGCFASTRPLSMASQKRESTHRSVVRLVEPVPNARTKTQSVLIL